MDILKQLFEKLNTKNLGSLANFIGDPKEEVGKAMELSIGSIFNGLVKESHTKEGAEKVLKVIEDGGHSGDILDDLPNLLSNPDKTQLLITIGTNINNHFFGNSIAKVSDKIAELTEVKKTSASSLVSFAAPVVLGFLGKEVRSRRLNISSFGDFMKNEGSGVKNVLPPSLASIFARPKVREQKSVNPEKVETKTQTLKTERREPNSLGFLAWLLLGALILAAVYYAFRNKISTPNTEISEEFRSAEDSLNQLNRSKLGVLDSSMVDGSSVGLDTDSSPSSALKEKNRSNNSIIDKRSKASNETSFGRESRRSEANPRELTNTGQNRSRTNTSQNSNAGEFKDRSKSYAPVMTQLQRSGSTVYFGTRQFQTNSAELRASSEIDQVVNFLNQNPNTNLNILGLGAKRLEEDRAYAIRGALYQKGIPLNRIQMISGSSGAGGSVKLSFN